MNLENRMVAAATPTGHPNDPTTRDLRRWECDCGADHGREVVRSGYSKWHSEGKFLEECAGNKNECGKRVCHECAVTCRVCGCHYCPEHQKGFNKDLHLCEDCGAGYQFAPDREAAEKMVAIEKSVYLARARFGSPHVTTAELDWLLAAVKEGWEHRQEDPEPECECRRIDVDLEDSSHCLLHGPNGELARRQRAQEAADEAAWAERMRPAFESSPQADSNRKEVVTS